MSKISLVFAELLTLIPVLETISNVNKPLTLLDIIKSDLTTVWMSFKLKVIAGVLREHVFVFWS